MALTVGIIQGKAPDGSGNGGVTEAQLSAPIVDFISPGARDAASMRVDPPGASARQVIIKAGRYYAPNATGTMVYVVDLDTDYTLSLATNGAGNPRISSIVLKIDKATTPNIYADNVATFVEVQGTAAASPSAPNDSNIQSGVGAGNVGVRLADVTLSAGYTTVTAPNIADKRTTAAIKLSTGAILLGYASKTSNTTTSSATPVAVSGLSAAVTIPSGGRSVELTFSANSVYASSAAFITISLWDGTVGSGTQIGSFTANPTSAGQQLTANGSVMVTPSAGAKTYNVGIQTSAGTATLVGSSTSPAQIAIKLI